MRLNMNAIKQTVKIKSILFMMVCLLISINLYSSYVENHPIELEQPDGTIIKAFVTGSNPRDGFNNLRAHNSENYTIIRDKKSYMWCWAKQASDGSLESTGYEVHLYDPKSLGLKPGEDISDEWNRQRYIEREKRRNKEGENIRSGIAP